MTLSCVTELLLVEWLRLNLIYVELLHEDLSTPGGNSNSSILLLVLNAKSSWTYGVTWDLRVYGRPPLSVIHVSQENTLRVSQIFLANFPSDFLDMDLLWNTGQDMECLNVGRFWQETMLSWVINCCLVQRNVEVVKLHLHALFLLQQQLL